MALGLLLVAAMVAGGCKSNTVKEPTLLIESVDARRLGYGIAWATKLGTPGSETLASVVVLGDSIFAVEHPSNLITAVALRDGSIRWRQKFIPESERLFEPVRFGDKLFINSETHAYLIDIPSGKLDEMQKLESVVSDKPALVENYAIFGGVTGRVFAHDIVTGYAKWAYQLAGGIVVTPVAAENHVLVVDSRGTYALLTATSGDLMWRGRTFGANNARPILSNLGVFVPSTDHNLYALNRSTGRDKPGKWPYRATQPLTEAPTLLGNAIYLPVPREGLVAVDAINGATLWSLPGNARPVLQREQQLLLKQPKSLLMVEAATGKTLFEAAVPRLHRVLTSDDGSLILVTREGRLVRLTPTN
jgi:outer membrane protein assembly factor BamB